MFGGLLDLRELQVSDVMVHRTEMVMINADLPPEELVREVLATEYTRIPLWRDKPENIIGVLHAKDLLRAIRASEGDHAKIDVSTIALPPWFVPEMRSVSEQLKAFRRRKTHFALVVDEYGEVEGMVTLEDILEEIVGDISDEHDVVVAGVRAQPDGSVVVDGSVPIRDLNRAMDWHLPDEEATTVAGLVIHEARSIPERGQSFTFHGFRFRVLRRERNRITALRIVPVPRESRDRGEKAEAGRDGVLKFGKPGHGSLAVIRESLPGFAGCLGFYREGVHGAREFPRQCRINHAMTLDPGLPFEGWRHNIHPEMRLAARPVAGMALMQMGFVRDLEAFRSESFAQLFCDSFLGAHGGADSMIFRQCHIEGEVFAMSRLEAFRIALS